MTHELETLGRFVRSVNSAFEASLTDDHDARLWERARNVVALGLLPALKALGGVVYVRDHEPTSPVDNCPNLICRVTADGRSFSIVPATVEACEGLPNADGFDWRGLPIGE